MTTEVSAEELHRIRRFLFEEAALLDDRRYRDWFALFTEDLVYEAPLRIHRQQHSLEDSWAVEEELSAANSLPLVRFDHAGLEASIGRILTGKTVNNDPPWFTERLITNVVADHGRDEGAFVARSKFLICRFKAGESQMIPGRRTDDLLLSNGRLYIRKRRIVLNSNTYAWGDFAYI